MLGDGLRARELKAVVGTLGVVVDGVVVVVVDVVEVVDVVVDVVVVVFLKLTRGMLMGDLSDGYFVEYFFRG